MVLYFSNNIAISDFDIKELPEFNGFWNQDINIDQVAVKNGKYKGEDYRYFTIKKAVLIPQKSGKLALESLSSDLIIGVPTGRGDFFGNPITRNIRKNFKTIKKINNKSKKNPKNVKNDQKNSTTKNPKKTVKKKIKKYKQKTKKIPKLSKMFLKIQFLIILIRSVFLETL